MRPRNWMLARWAIREIYWKLSRTDHIIFSVMRLEDTTNATSTRTISTRRVSCYRRRVGERPLYDALHRMA
eukprot:280034-Pleurochrysis_carterae.AAC.1